MVELPKQRLPAESKSPQRTFIYSAPKIGKTTAVAMLDNCLVLDLEGGAKFVDAMRIHIQDLTSLKAVLAQIKKDGKPYKYGAVDTTTKLEEMVIPLAGDLYRKTNMGEHWGKIEKGPNTGKIDPTANVLTLPRGAGYLYLRKAFSMVMEAIDDVFERVIYLGHLKDISLGKEGKEVAVKDIDLTGKLKNITCANTDAIGFMYREENKTILSFKTGTDVISGARPQHLRNQDIVLLESDEDGNITNHGWDKIYID